MRADFLNTASIELPAGHAVEIDVTSRDRFQNLYEAWPAVTWFLRKVGASPEWLPVGSEEDGQRPPALFAHGCQGRHIDLVYIWPLLAIDLDVHEKAVHDSGDFVVFKALMGHDMAPVTGGVTD